MVIILLALYLYRRGKSLWVLPLGLGVLTHLVFDQMWTDPQTLFWPLLGFKFPYNPESDWLGSIFEAYRSVPSDYIPEIIGALILGAFLWYLLRTRRMGGFLRGGEY